MAAHPQPSNRALNLSLLSSGERTLQIQGSLHARIQFLASGEKYVLLGVSSGDIDNRPGPLQIVPVNR